MQYSIIETALYNMLNLVSLSSFHKPRSLQALDESI